MLTVVWKTNSGHLSQIILFMVIGHWTYDKEPQWLRDETCCCHYMGNSFLLGAKDLLWTPSHRLDNTYHGFEWNNN